MKTVAVACARLPIAAAHIKVNTRHGVRSRVIEVPERSEFCGRQRQSKGDCTAGHSSQVSDVRKFCDQSSKAPAEAYTCLLGGYLTDVIIPRRATYQDYCQF